MTDEVNAPAQHRGLALGCGGTLGFAWTVGALAAIRDETGWEARDADALIGTSAGAEMTVLLGSGSSVSELISFVHGKNFPGELAAYRNGAPGAVPPIPRFSLGSPRLATRRELPPLSRASGLAPVGRGRPDFLRQLAKARVADDGWLPHPSAWLVGMDYDTGERMAFGSPGAEPASLADALCASWAVPGWFPPIRIGARRFIDGGASSTASADLLIPLGLDEVLVIAPMASIKPLRPHGFGRIENRVLRRPMTSILNREVEALQNSGTRVVTLTATDDDLNAMGANFMDPRNRVAAFESGRRTVQHALATTHANSIRSEGHP